MNKKVRSFRLSDETIRRLDAIRKLKNEELKVWCEKQELKGLYKNMEIGSLASMIDWLINDEYERLKEEGYNV